MKSKPEAIYKIELTGEEISTLRAILLAHDVNSLSEEGSRKAEALFERFENDIEEIKNIKTQE